MAIKKTTLGNIPQLGTSDILSLSEKEKKKREEEQAKERAVFQAAVVPVAQIFGGAVGGVAGAGLGGAVGEGLRQFQGGEQADVGKVLKEGAIGAGTQFLGGKIGEWLTKGKGVASVAEKPNIFQKAGENLKKSKFDIEAKIKAGGYDADTASRIEAAIRNPEYGLLDAPTAKAARTIKTNLLKTNKDIAEKAIKNSTRVPNPIDLWSTIEPELKNVKLDNRTISEIKTWATKIGDANTDEELYKIQGALKKYLDATLEPGARVNTGEKLVQKAFHDSINNYLKEIPAAKKALEVQSDMHLVSKAIGSGVKKAEKGIKVPIIGNVGGGELLQGTSTMTGKALEKIGGGLPAVSGLGLPPIAGKLVAPAMQAGLGTPSIPQPTEQGLPEIPQETVKDISPTGRTLEDHKNAYMAALQAGDTKSAARIKQMYDMEASFQKETKSKQTGTMAQEAQKKIDSMVNQAIKDVDSGKVRTGIIAGPLEQLKGQFNMADQPTLEFQKLSAIIKADIVKAKAGTALTPTEEALLNQYVPQVGDSTQNVKTKLKMLQKTSNYIVESYKSQNNPDTLPDIGMGSIPQE